MRFFFLVTKKDEVNNRLYWLKYYTDACKYASFEFWSLRIFFFEIHHRKIVFLLKKSLAHRSCKVALWSRCVVRWLGISATWQVNWHLLFKNWFLNLENVFSVYKLIFQNFKNSKNTFEIIFSNNFKWKFLKI